jgi:hypothetical protein
LADELRSQGWDVHLNAFIVWDLGGWDPYNETVIRQLRISKSYIKLMKKLIISNTIYWSLDIQVDFISGKRQHHEVAPINPIPHIRIATVLALINHVMNNSLFFPKN